MALPILYIFNNREQQLKQDKLEELKLCAKQDLEKIRFQAKLQG